MISLTLIVYDEIIFFLKSESLIKSKWIIRYTLVFLFKEEEETILYSLKIEKQLRKHKEKAQALRNKKGSKSKDKNLD